MLQDSELIGWKVPNLELSRNNSVRAHTGLNKHNKSIRQEETHLSTATQIERKSSSLHIISDIIKNQETEMSLYLLYTIDVLYKQCRDPP